VRVESKRRGMAQHDGGTVGELQDDILLWDDNPAEIDLLGFDAVVAPVLAAVAMPDLDPLTIGVHGPWGGGKSTVLGLLSTELATGPYIVVRTNPWEYDDHADVKGTLIAQILQALEDRFHEDAGIRDKVKGLLTRISWSRATTALAKGVLTMQWDMEKLVEAFTPKEKDKPESMAGFRDAFADLIENLPEVDRVVVLVDDLDRCLPRAVMATLEAIKLFLSVRRMVFVVAADQSMVRNAISADLANAPRGETFAKHYLDKIVQLPVTLPRLAPQESEAYVGLLLSRPQCDEEQYAALVEHCRTRRRNGLFPLLGDMRDLSWRPDDDLLVLAGQLTHGLRSDRVSNPREIKRFLNAFGVRHHIAKARGLDIRPALIAKLLLLEDRYYGDFEKLAAAPEADRSDLLQGWETWARTGEGGPPDGISEESKTWAAAEPSLAGEDLGPYITLAASLAATVSLVAGMSDELAALLVRMIGPSEADRPLAIEAAADREVSDQRVILQGLFERTRQIDDIALIVWAAVELAKATTALADDVAAGIREHCWHRLDPGAAVDLAGSGVPALTELARELRDDQTIEPDVRAAVGEVLDANQQS
jgi:hypothetical protein